MITFLRSLLFVAAYRGLSARASVCLGYCYIVGHLLLEVRNPLAIVLRSLGVDYNLAPSWSVVRLYTLTLTLLAAANGLCFDLRSAA